MKTKELKNKVIAHLIKCGHNKNDVNKMVELHFVYASETYSSVKTIAGCISTIY